MKHQKYQDVIDILKSSNPLNGHNLVKILSFLKNNKTQLHFECQKLYSKVAIDRFVNSESNTASSNYVSEVLENELRLLERDNFVTFLNDVVYNTITQTSDKRVAIPVLDRFRDLLICLHNPQNAYRLEDVRARLLKDMELTLGLSSPDRALAFNLINDTEFMLRYQVVAFAKNHNFLGGLDKYMKQFARICLELGNREISNNLERVLNSEVSIKINHTSKNFLDLYKNLNTEVPGQLLAQPAWRFMPAGMKLHKINQYKNLLI